MFFCADRQPVGQHEHAGGAQQLLALLQRLLALPAEQTARVEAWANGRVHFSRRADGAFCLAVEAGKVQPTLPAAVLCAVGRPLQGLSFLRGADEAVLLGDCQALRLRVLSRPCRDGSEMTEFLLSCPWKLVASVHLRLIGAEDVQVCRSGRLVLGEGPVPLGRAFCDARAHEWAWLGLTVHGFVQDPRGKTLVQKLVLSVDAPPPEEKARELRVPLREAAFHPPRWEEDRPRYPRMSLPLPVRACACEQPLTAPSEAAPSEAAQLVWRIARVAQRLWPGESAVELSPTDRLRVHVAPGAVELRRTVLRYPEQAQLVQRNAALEREAALRAADRAALDARDAAPSALFEGHLGEVRKLHLQREAELRLAGEQLVPLREVARETVLRVQVETLLCLGSTVR